MRSSSSIVLIALAGLALSGGQAVAQDDACRPENDCVPLSAAERAPPLTPTGPPVEIAPEPDPARARAASAVPWEEEEQFSEQMIRLVATPGDAAGTKRLYARLPLGEGRWAIYPIAEVLGHGVVSVQDHILGIELVEPVRDASAGRTGENRRRIIVAYVDGSEGVGESYRPVVTSFTIAPAR